MYYEHYFSRYLLKTLIVWARYIGSIASKNNRGAQRYEYNCLWVQLLCLGTIIVSLLDCTLRQNCLGTVEWAQSCLVTIACGNSRVWAQS